MLDIFDLTSFTENSEKFAYFDRLHLTGSQLQPFECCVSLDELQQEIEGFLLKGIPAQIQHSHSRQSFKITFPYSNY